MIKIIVELEPITIEMPADFTAEDAESMDTESIYRLVEGKSRPLPQMSPLVIKTWSYEREDINCRHCGCTVESPQPGQLFCTPECIAAWEANAIATQGGC